MQAFPGNMPWFPTPFILLFSPFKPPRALHRLPSVQPAFSSEKRTTHRNPWSFSGLTLAGKSPQLLLARLEFGFFELIESSQQRCCFFMEDDESIAMISSFSPFFLEVFLE